MSKPDDVKGSGAAGAAKAAGLSRAPGPGMRREKAGVVTALVLLAIFVVVAFPLLRAEVSGIGVALSVAGEDAGARRAVVGGSLYLVAEQTASFVPSSGRLTLLTLARAFGSVGSRLRYNLYPLSVDVKEFGLPFAKGKVAAGDFILIYIPAEALKSRQNKEAVSGIEAAMVRNYALERLFSRRFTGRDGRAGAYGALFRVGGGGKGA